MKKVIKLILLFLLLVLSGLFFYMYFSYIFALLKSNMNSFFSMPECIIGSIISGTIFILTIIVIIRVFINNKKESMGD